MLEAPGSGVVGNSTATASLNLAIASIASSSGSSHRNWNATRWPLCTARTFTHGTTASGSIGVAICCG